MKELEYKEFLKQTYFYRKQGRNFLLVSISLFIITTTILFLTFGGA